MRVNREEKNKKNLKKGSLDKDQASTARSGSSEGGCSKQSSVAGIPSPLSERLRDYTTKRTRKMLKTPHEYYAITKTFYVIHKMFIDINKHSLL
jgi:hypothetical protein